MLAEAMRDEASLPPVMAYRPRASGKPGPLAAAIARSPTPLIGALIGGFSAIAGVGGASLTVPYLLSKNAEMKRAVTSASAVGLGIALVGASSFALASMHAIDPQSADVGGTRLLARCTDSERGFDLHGFTRRCVVASATRAAIKASLRRGLDRSLHDDSRETRPT
jgi:Sulfite exporter TauE/SafE